MPLLNANVRSELQSAAEALRAAEVAQPAIAGFRGVQKFRDVLFEQIPEYKINLRARLERFLADIDSPQSPGPELRQLQGLRTNVINAIQNLGGPGGNPSPTDGGNVDP